MKDACAKTWCDLSSENNHEVRRLREAFLRYHRNANEIVMTSSGVPLQAIYFTPEMPGYGEIRSDVPSSLPSLRDVNQ